MNKKILAALVVIIVVIIVVVGLILFLTGGKYSTPQRTMKTLFAYTEKGDVDGFVSCFTEESQKLLIESGIKDQTPEELKNSSGMEDFKDLEFEITEETEDTAVLKAKGESGLLVFKKEKGWKIDLEATFSKMFETGIEGIE